MNKWISEQPSPWRKSSKRKSCYGDRVYNNTTTTTTTAAATAANTTSITTTTNNSDTIITNMIDNDD